ncbi:ribosomal RNA processing protein 6 [Trypanosoma theileri]|uniref:Ribosomal RNA processing protein 6 n=1 Tax=Trypanosoma theileri TaxID=67003 RepID=A0A1X0P9Z3_9TRYP|nr:ribosomal RNA processing protein 6 [Trypanosoma theileri]ORC93708.1 ribosomal RNA processing protein 6 [Trypanosoma theileri]
MSDDLPNTRDIVKGVFSVVKEYSKLAGELPVDDYDYHMAFPGFGQQIKRHGEALVTLMDKCCQLIPARRRVSLQGCTGCLNEPQRAVVMEAVDSLLENVDGLLDDLKGRRLSARDQLSVTFGSELQSSSNSPNEFSGHVFRPQLTFEHPVDNSTDPFAPIYYDEKGEKHVAQPGVHPFFDQIKNAPINEEQLLRCADTTYLPLATCPLRFLDSVTELEQMVEVLLQEKEIAVDLEHHDFYSYQGFTCLMQISTRTEDFIIDCLKLRSSMYKLAPVFLHPRILKVFHGAREDVRWLQKDFGLYIANLFDTGIALQTLHMPHSLAFAVDHFCQVKLNKKYQTADWRIRPIPAEMVAYARQDTHFLLYVYDRLKALLLNSEGRASVGNLLVHVINESRRLSLELYEKPQLEPNTTYKLALGRSLGGLSSVQMQVARDIFNWRDTAAREVDDSPAAVMHLSSVLAIATKLPTSASQLLKCCSPISLVTRSNVMKLVQIVKDAVGNSITVKQQEEEIKMESKEDTKEVSRPVGVHQPMTGTLPSIEQGVTPELAYETNTCTVVHSQPSAWFTTMRNLASVLRSRSQLAVPLPGQEVMAMLLHAKSINKRPRGDIAEASSLQEDETTLKDTVEDDSLHNHNSNEEEGEEKEKNELEKNSGEQAAEDQQAVKPLELGQQAMALRQKYGLGSANRKKAKVERRKNTKDV